MIRYPHPRQDYSLDRKDIPPATLVLMLRSMLRIRRIEETIESRYHEDEMKTPIHLVIGQEATSVGSCTALRREDLIFLGHRTHGHYLAKGGDLKAMMAELYCRVTGCAGSRGGSMHLFDPQAGVASSSAICGGAVPIATGAALAMQMRKEDRVAVVYFGDGASEEGVVWESLNFAALKKLPIVFICENNFYSVCSPLEKRQPNVPIYRKAEAFGLRAQWVDGINVADVFDATREATFHAREGRGPTFIESRAYRWRAHGGAGDDSVSGYRDPEEVKTWQRECPIEILNRYLLEAELFTKDARLAMEAEIAQEIDDAFRFAIDSAVPAESDLATHVYCESPTKSR